MADKLVISFESYTIPRPSSDGGGKLREIMLVKSHVTGQRFSDRVLSSLHELEFEFD